MSKSSQAEGILFQKNGNPVPLAGVEVQGDIIGRGAKVTIHNQNIPLLCGDESLGASHPPIFVQPNVAFS